MTECRWKKTRWDDEEPLNAPKLFSSDAIDTGDSAIGEVDEFTEWAERILRLLPEVLSIEGTGYLGRAERVEKLSEGERLVVAGDWNNDGFGSVCLEVFNDRGETLGNLSIREESEYASMLARVLPHLIASVEKMTPSPSAEKEANARSWTSGSNLLRELLTISSSPPEKTIKRSTEAERLYSAAERSSVQKTS